MQYSTKILIGVFFFFSCTKRENTSQLIVKLTDSPGDYEKVNIDLQAVEVHSSSNEIGGWVALNTNSGIYDLLTLTNGVESVIANDAYPSGRISQIRLVLGNNNSVVVSGVEESLKVPSSAESGLKVLVNTDLVEGITYSILLDFDAATSVVKNGASGKYSLKPVIKAITKAQDGAIRGMVSPGELSVAVYALSGTDTMSTSYAIAGESNFFLGGLRAGTYTVSFDPGKSSSYMETSIENIDVTLGKVTMVKSVDLIQ